MFGIAYPRHAVAGLLADDPADFLEQALLIGGSQQDLVAVADRAQFTIQTMQRLLCLLAGFGQAFLRGQLNGRTSRLMVKYSSEAVTNTKIIPLIVMTASGSFKRSTTASLNAIHRIATTA